MLREIFRTSFTVFFDQTSQTRLVMPWSYLSEYLSDHLANVLPPLWDVWVQSVQVCAEAQRDDLEVI